MNLHREKRRTAFGLISPAVAVIVAINIFPILFALYISLHFWSFGRGEPRFAGFFNYEELFYDDRFINAILTSGKFVFLAVAIEFLIGFGLAFLFNQKVRGLVTLRKIAILPIMVMPLVAGLVWFYLFNENFGAINWFITILGFDKVAFLTDLDVALWSLVAADVWQWTPFVMLVMFAALQSLPEYVYEAARMDGLDRWQTFWRVTVPMLKPSIMIVVLLRIVDSFKMIELVFMMTKGGPAGRTEVLPWYLYVTGFQSMDLGYAAAMAVVMLIIITLVTQIFVRGLEYREGQE
ncbi:MAG: sugar ABC transporter permease [Azospirillaceae bacterium]